MRDSWIGLSFDTPTLCHPWLALNDSLVKCFAQFDTRTFYPWPHVLGSGLYDFPHILGVPILRLISSFNRCFRAAFAN